jgi:arsenite methyltransferase
MGARMGGRFDVERAVLERYSRAARQPERALCCPTTYDPRFLEVLPPEIVERDYGCGDPTRYVRAGETVLDLGSGSGKACFIASQVVGPEGRVIGVDLNPDMLALARAHAPKIGDRIGWRNVEFRRGRIQDLQTDLDALDAWLRAHPVRSADDWMAFEAFRARQREEAPLVASDSVDVVVSNCVLNLVAESEKRQLFAEIFRVLKRGGRAVISDIVSDEPVPEHLKADPELWSGCISGALTEEAFLRAFVDAGFYGVRILERQDAPWQTIEGIEFRSVTVAAYKGKEGPCLETNKAVIYLGPWREVRDDDGHIFRRGVREAVCEKTFGILMREPYAGQFAAVLPYAEIPVEAAQPFDCRRRTPRHPRETKGADYEVTRLSEGGPCCGPGGC